MKWALIPLVALAGCSSTKTPEPTTFPNQKLVIEGEVSAMSRNEVIMAINECESNRTRAVVIMAKQKVSGRTTDVVTDVTCAPKYTY